MCLYCLLVLRWWSLGFFGLWKYRSLSSCSQGGVSVCCVNFPFLIRTSVILDYWPTLSNPNRWCCESAALNMPANLENSAVTTGLERSVFIPISKKGNAKECSDYRTIALISHASKLMVKILQARLQQYMNQEILDVQDGFRKGRQTRDQIVRGSTLIETSHPGQAP